MPTATPLRLPQDNPQIDKYLVSAPDCVYLCTASRAYGWTCDGLECGPGMRQHPEHFCPHLAAVLDFIRSQYRALSKQDG